MLALNQGVMEDLQNEAPFMLATVCVAITTGWVVRTFPFQHGIQRPAQERLLAGDRGYQLVHVVQVLAHGLVAGIARRGGAAHFDKTVASLWRAERNEIFVSKRPAEIGAGRAIVTKTALDGAIRENLE